MVAKPSWGETGDALDRVLVTDGLAESRGGPCRCRCMVKPWAWLETVMALGDTGDVG
jgi:hypothetical protein